MYIFSLGDENLKKILITYYTRSGHTEKLVTKLAEYLDADIEKLIDLKNRKGLLGFFRGGKDASQKKLTDIDQVKYNPNNYDLVVLATPTWASTVSPALRTYIEKHKTDFKNVAFLVSQGGGCNGKIYKDLETLTGKSPAAAVDFSRSELSSKTWAEKLKTFAENLNK